MNFNHITLLHGRGDSPDGSIKSLETALRSAHAAPQYVRPFLPDYDTKKTFEWFERFCLYRVPQNSLLVGIDRGGLIACAVQSAYPALRLSVVAINSPTEEDMLIADQCAPHSRVALYSSAYPPIRERCDWKKLTPLAYDVPWLASGNQNFYALAYLVSAYGRDADMEKEISMLLLA